MRVYRPAPLEGFEWVVPVREDDFEVFRSFDGTPRRQDWVPVPVERVTVDESGHPLEESDFPWLGSHALVLRDQAVQALTPVLDDQAEVPPLACEDAELRVLNVLRVVDALDEERSELVRFSSGRVMKIDRHVFRPEAVKGSAVFKVPQMLRGSIFLTDDFVNAVESAGLRGLGFDLVWEDADL